MMIYFLYKLENLNIALVMVSVYNEIERGEARFIVVNSDIKWYCITFVVWKVIDKRK